MLFPSGDYYVGDLCYALPHGSELWERFIGAWNAIDWRGAVEVTYQGLPVWNGLTAYGDGCFVDNHGHAYAVDSGSIGIMPVALCDPKQLKGIGEYAHIITMPDGCTPTLEDGVFTFGHTIINTRGDADEEQ